MNKTCLECNDKIVGREDKKFCSDGCRNAYNNKINKDSTNYMRNINNKLRKNYRVLAELNPEGKSKTSKSKPFTVNDSVSCSILYHIILMAFCNNRKIK